MVALWQLGVAESARLIRQGELSPVELVRALLDRIAQRDGALRAWVLIDEKAALQAAQRLEAGLGQRARRAALAGVPFGLKDIYDARGLPTRAGSRAMADAAEAEADAAAVANLRRRGGIVLGKVQTCEFASADPSPSRNPWNAAHTPGGSSSGSAVAVASGMLPLALGSQTGGSTVRPAAYNGIVGLKPTYGLLSCHGVIANAWSFDTVGILARSVEDVALALDAAVGFDPRDPASIRAPAGRYHAAATSLATGPRIGVLREYFLERCTPDATARFEQDLAHLASQGATLVEVQLPDRFHELHDEHRLIGDSELANYHRDRFEQRADLYGPKIAIRVRAGFDIQARDYVRAQRQRYYLSAALRRLASEVDLLATPATPGAAPADLTSTGDPSFQTPWSYSGLPSLAIPSGLADSGLPLGLQLIGRYRGDAALLRGAAWCERALAGGAAMQRFREAQRPLLD